MRILSDTEEELRFQKLYGSFEKLNTQLRKLGFLNGPRYYGNDEFGTSRANYSSSSNLELNLTLQQNLKFEGLEISLSSVPVTDLCYFATDNPIQVEKVIPILEAYLASVRVGKKYRS